MLARRCVACYAPMPDRRRDARVCGTRCRARLLRWQVPTLADLPLDGDDFDDVYAADLQFAEAEA